MNVQGRKLVKKLEMMSSVSHITLKRLQDMKYLPPTKHFQFYFGEHPGELSFMLANLNERNTFFLQSFNYSP